MYLLPLPEAEWEAVLANLMNTARELAKLRASALGSTKNCERLLRG